MACGLAEHLAVVPRDVCPSDRCSAWLRNAQGLPYKPQQQLVYPRASMDLLGDEHPSVGIDTKRTAIECLVVEDTQSQAVVFVIRSTCRVPADVCSLKPQMAGTQPAIKPTHGAAMLVDAQDGLSEMGVALGPRHNNPRHAHSIQDILVE